MTLISLINNFLSIGVAIGQLFILWVIINFLFYNKKQNFLSNFFGQHGLVLAFLVAFISTLGSLFYSEIVGFVPCVLCWYQRALMYPQVLLLSLPIMFKNGKKIINYSIVLSAMGLLLSGYHYLLQFNIIDGLPCPAVGYSVSCSKLFIIGLGYVTIPLMSFTAFLMIIIFLIFHELKNRFV